MVVQPFSTPRAGTAPTCTLRWPKRRRNSRTWSASCWSPTAIGTKAHPPVEAASQLRLKGIPVFAVPVGQPTRLPDVELLSVDAPTFGVVGKSVRIPFTIESSLPREFVNDGRAAASERRRGRKRNSHRPDGPHERCDRVETKGDRRLHADVGSAEASRRLATDNNKLTVPISIREEKLRVLIVESLPRWEYRYLRNALSRDPGVSLRACCFIPASTKSAAATKTTSKNSPKGSINLPKYDVVFLGDVGLEQANSPPTNADC